MFSETPADTIPTMTHVLYRHQIEGIEWLRGPGRAKFLWDDQGLGKTVQVLVALAKDPSVLPHLVLCPAAVAVNWANEARKWAPNLKVAVLLKYKDKIPDDADLVVATYTVIRNAKTFLSIISRSWGTLVCDEAHYLKTPGTERTKQVLGKPGYSGTYERIERHCARCWMLTGTPMPNNPTELYTVVRALAPDALALGHGGAPMTYRHFVDRFCVTEWVPFGNGVSIIGAKNQAELRSRLAPWVLRRKKSEVLDLPPIRWATVPASVDLAANEELAALEAEIRARVGDIEDEDAFLAAMLSDVAYPVWRRLCAVAKVGATADILKDELLNTPAKKIVIMAHHTEALEKLQQEFSAFRPVMITGSTSPSARASLVAEFQTNPKTRVFLGQILAAGVGITLTSAADLVFLELSYTPGNNAQAADRVYRIGQDKSVLIRVMHAAGTCDDRVSEILTRKTEMIQSIIQ